MPAFDCCNVDVRHALAHRSEGMRVEGEGAFCCAASLQASSNSTFQQHRRLLSFTDSGEMRHHDSGAPKLHPVRHLIVDFQIQLGAARKRQSSQDIFVVEVVSVMVLVVVIDQHARSCKPAARDAQPKEMSGCASAGSPKLAVETP